MSQLSRVDFDDDLDVSFMNSKERRQLLGEHYKLLNHPQTGILISYFADLSEGPKKKHPRLTHQERVTEKEGSQANPEWRRPPSLKMGCSINNVYAKLQKVFGGDIRKESEQKRFVIKFIQELVKAAYSPEN
ncbi:hypothetical protein Aduo_001828 [Ancylostoma duodenale]